MYGVINVPLNDQEEVIQVDLNDEADLRENSDNVLDILTSERAPLKSFLEFALGFSTRNFKNEVEKFLETAIKIGQNKNDKSPEFCLIINTLASHLIEKATFEIDTKTKNGIFQRATEFLNIADKINPRETVTLDTKGALLIAKKQYDQAINQFKISISQNDKNIVAFLGMAKIHLEKKQYKSALEFYQKALQINPQYSPDLRVPIGICFFKLDMFKEARKAFERAYERNYNNMKAVLMIALMEMNEASSSNKSKEEIMEIKKKATVLMKHIYDSDKIDAKVLVTVADLAIRHDKLDIAQIMINHVFNLPVRTKVLAEAHLLRGHIYHIYQDYVKAKEHYLNSVNLDPTCALAQYNLGQMYIYNDEDTNAIECFKKVLSQEPDSYETLRLLATLYRKKPETLNLSVTSIDKLKKLLKTYHEEDYGKKGVAEEEYIKDPEILLEMARVMESQDLKSSLKYYKQVESIFESGTEPIPAELYNNIACLFMISDDAECAETYFNKANERSKDSTQTSNHVDVTIQYNMARLKEINGDSKFAQQAYKQLIEEHPTYTDAYLRLGAMKMDKMQIPEAQSFFKQVMAIDEKNVDARILFALSQMLQKSYRDSRKTFEIVTKELDAADMYSNCSLGNLSLNFARADPKNRPIHYKRACEFFLKALKTDPHSHIAAMGMGICMAENGHLQQAKDIFQQIQTAHPSLAAIINIGHVCMAQENYTQAINMYQSGLKKSEKKDVYLSLCIARAQYVSAKHDKDPESMLEAIQELEQLEKLSPQDGSVRYNLALSKQQFVSLMTEQPFEKRPLNRMESAMKMINEAQELFKTLSEYRSDKNLGYDVKHVIERYGHCQNVKKMCEKKLHETKILVEQREQRKKEVLDMQKQREMERLERDRQKVEEEARKQSEIEEQRRQLQKKVQEDNERMALALQEEEDRRKRQKSVSSDDEGDNNRSDVEAQQRKRKKMKKSAGGNKKKSFAGEASGATLDLKPVERKHNRYGGYGEDLSDDEQEKLKAKANKIGKASALSAAIIEDSDEEEDDMKQTKKVSQTNKNAIDREDEDEKQSSAVVKKKVVDDDDEVDNKKDEMDEDKDLFGSDD